MPEALGEKMTDTIGKGKYSWLGRLVGVGGFLVGALAMNLLLSNGKPDSKMMEEALAGTKLGTVIKREFPEDYKNAVVQLTTVAQDRSIGAVERGQRAAQITAEIRKKYSAFAGRAPDPLLRKVLETQVDMLQAIKHQRGVSLCSEIAIQGPAAMAGKASAREFDEVVDLAATAMMEAMAEGRRHPVQRVVADRGDFDLLFANTRARGVSDETIARMADGVVRDEACVTTLTVMEEAIALKGENGERVRSYLVDASATGT